MIFGVALMRAFRWRSHSPRRRCKAWQVFRTPKYCFYFIWCRPRRLFSARAIRDIKPVLAEFLPRQAIREPAWSHELMRDYWLSKAL